MRLFNKVAIIGVGLIGGSIGQIIKRKKLASTVVGVARHKKTLIQAKKQKAIDSGSTDIKIIKGADLVILAMPVEIIIKLAPAISKIVRKNCIVTDVGSTKQQIVSKLHKIFPYYIGAHPLAGSEKRGIANACDRLFVNSLCLLTPVRNTKPIALKKVKNFWQMMGARVKLVSPDKHDQTLSFISHLPHAAAFSLINCVPQGCLKFAAGGFKDTTRIAASNAEIWSDIFLSNRRNLLKAIALFQDNIAAIKSAISRKDKKALNGLLKKAKTKRENLR